jgi:hypothetical protein
MLTTSSSLLTGWPLLELATTTDSAARIKIISSKSSIITSEVILRVILIHRPSGSILVWRRLRLIVVVLILWTSWRRETSLLLLMILWVLT